jgi:PAS domain S-box-containing protein
MRRSAHILLADYGVAVLAVAVLLRWLLDPWLGDDRPLPTLYGAVAVAVWYGGYRPALLASVLGYLACAYLFIGPRNQLLHFQARDLTGLLLYAVSCAIIIAFGQALHATHRRLADHTARLRQSDAFHHAIADLSSDYAWTARVEPDGSVVTEMVTDGFTRLFGYTLNELIARGGWKTLVYPEDMARAEQTIEALLAGKTAEGEIRNVSRDGRVVWLRYRNRPLKDEQGRVVRLIGAVQDITEWKCVAEALQTAQAQLRIVTDHMAAAVTRCSRDRR